jgi:hypothetical protein
MEVVRAIMSTGKGPGDARRERIRTVFTDPEVTSSGGQHHSKETEIWS